ncbi:MAG TPA: hypothetical protein VIU12_35310 [Chryseolinea sp.]
MPALKYIGFIKEHDDNFAESLSFDDIKKSVYENDLQRLPEIIHYLGHGAMVLAFMGYSFDLETNHPIGGNSIHTDGVWVWPFYFPYYLDKFPNYPLDQEFVNHLHQQSFKRRLVSKEEIEIVCDQVVLYFSKRDPIRKET